MGMSTGYVWYGAERPAEPQLLPLFLVNVLNMVQGYSQEGNTAASKTGNSFLLSCSAMALYVFTPNYNMVLI